MFVCWTRIWSEVHILLPLFINRSRAKNFPVETFLKVIVPSIKNLGEFEYGKQNCHRHQKTQVWLKNSKWGLPPVTTVQKLKSVHNKNFPTETLLKTIVSKIKNRGKLNILTETGYNIKKPQLAEKTEVKVILLSLYINWSIAKHFLIKTLLKMTDSTCPRFFMLESVLSEIVLIGNFFGMDRFRILYSGNRW